MEQIRLTKKIKGVVHYVVTDQTAAILTPHKHLAYIFNNVNEARLFRTRHRIETKRFTVEVSNNTLNVGNVFHAIRVMRDAQKHQSLFMPNFQCDKDWPQRKTGILIQSKDFCSNIKDLHACGNKACFIGHLSLTPKYQHFFLQLATSAVIDHTGTVDLFPIDLTFYAGGGTINTSMVEISFDPVSNLANFLGLSYGMADNFIHNAKIGPDSEFFYYGVKFEHVEPHHVISRLKELLAQHDAAVAA